MALNMQASLTLATEGVNTPGMALSTPMLPAPAAILPVASTALSVNAAQPAIQLDPDRIAEKWGHPNGSADHAGPKQVCSQFFLALPQGISSGVSSVS